MLNRHLHHLSGYSQFSRPTTFGQTPGSLLEPDSTCKNTKLTVNQSKSQKEMTITNVVLKVQISLETQANTGGIATLGYVCWKRKKKKKKRYGLFYASFSFMCLSEQGLAGSSLLDAGIKISRCGFTACSSAKPFSRVRERNQGKELSRFLLTKEQDV